MNYSQKYDEYINEMQGFRNELTSEISKNITLINKIINYDLRHLFKLYGGVIDFTDTLITSLLYLESQDALDASLANKAVKWIEKNLDYTTPPEWFAKNTYNSFSDWFTRQLTKEKYAECKEKANNAVICSPAECELHSFGDVDNNVNIKNTYIHLGNGLKKLGINLRNYFFMNFKLHRCYYHRLHSPIEGTIKSIKKIKCNESLLFGKNFGIIVEIKNTNGIFYLLIIGELAIQNFVLLVSKGDKLYKTQQIGKFLAGSQAILLGPNSLMGTFKGESGHKYFLGDTIVN